MKATAQMGGLTLLPCPFCGSKVAREDFVENTGGNRRFIWCANCSAHGPWSIPVASAAELWNDRSLESVRSEALEEAAQAIEDWHEEPDDAWAERQIADGLAAHVRALKGKGASQGVDELVCPMTAQVCYDPRAQCKPGYCRRQLAPEPSGEFVRAYCAANDYINALTGSAIIPPESMEKIKAAYWDAVRKVK